MINLYSTSDVAKMFGCSVPTIKRWVCRGSVYHIKTIGGKMLLSNESISQLKKMMNFKDELINSINK